MTLTPLKDMQARIDEWERLIVAGRAQDPSKWLAKAHSGQVFNGVGPEMVEVISAALGLCASHGGQPKTRMVLALLELNEALAARLGELETKAPTHGGNE